MNQYIRVPLNQFQDTKFKFVNEPIGGRGGRTMKNMNYGGHPSELTILYSTHGLEIK